MQVSSLNVFTAVWLFLCFVSPLQSDAQNNYWPDHAVYNPTSHRSHHAQDISRVNVQRNLPRAPARRTEYEYTRNPWVPAKYGYPGRDTSRETILDTGHVASQREETEFHYAYADPTQDNKKEPRTGNKESFQELEDRQINPKEEDITRQMNILERFLSEDSSEKGLETNTIDDRIIAETNVTEDAKRAVRQVRKQRPGFFWTLARITFETFNDTRSAIKQISEIINNSIAADTTTQRSVTSSSLKANGTASTTPSNVDVTTEASTTITTTTEEEYVLTRSDLQTIIRRNILGLIRLFNIEWNDAINQSEVSVREFQKDLGNQVGTFLQDNPDAY